MKLRLMIAGAGNLIDTAATLYLVAHGYTESNPLMRQLLQYPQLFVAVKLGLMTALLCYLWQKQTDKHAKPLAALAAAVYGGISIYYGVFFAALL